MKLDTNGKSIFLAYDQGLEHGPMDLNLNNCNPEFIIKLADKAKINGMILHHGIAEKYFSEKKYTVPLIIKLNGKTKFASGDPLSQQVCSVGRALRLGAKAVGYTIYPGSKYEAMMFTQLGNIVEKAHRLDIPVIVWVYPRGDHIDANASETIAYAARIALELGADFAKIHYNRDFEGFKWATKVAGKCKVVVVGGNKTTEVDFLTMLKEAIGAGAVGTALGRNIWQHPQPGKMLEAVKDIIYNKKEVSQALRRLL